MDVSEKIQSHLSAMSKAREAFIQAESDKTIAEALKVTAWMPLGNHQMPLCPFLGYC